MCINRRFVYAKRLILEGRHASLDPLWRPDGAPNGTLSGGARLPAPRRSSPRALVGCAGPLFALPTSLWNIAPRLRQTLISVGSARRPTARGPPWATRMALEPMKSPCFRHTSFSMPSEGPNYVKCPFSETVVLSTRNAYLWSRGGGRVLTRTAPWGPLGSSLPGPAPRDP